MCAVSKQTFIFIRKNQLIAWLALVCQYDNIYFLIVLFSVFFSRFFYGLPLTSGFALKIQCNTCSSTRVHRNNTFLISKVCTTTLF